MIQWWLKANLLDLLEHESRPLADRIKIHWAISYGQCGSRETILNFASKLGSEDRRKTMRETNDIVLDCALYLWFSQRKNKGDPILGSLLCEKALELKEKFDSLADFSQNEVVQWYSEK
ncbi:hypothetical protein TNCV_4686531 [Trichonephila clavipes]|nr:hypothetical protein TNCV_4686531 [Trichonephila clavipes]